MPLQIDAKDSGSPPAILRFTALLCVSKIFFSPLNASTALALIY